MEGFVTSSTPIDALRRSPPLNPRTISEPQYEQGEIDDGFKPVWMDLDTAIEKMKTCTPVEPYLARFITTREGTFLEEAKLKV